MATRIVRYSVVFFFSAFLITGHLSYAQPNAKKASTAQHLSSKQAQLVARRYFENHFGGCGGVYSPTDKGSHWEFSTLIGRGATPGPQIIVNKSTAEVSLLEKMKNKPSISMLPRAGSSFIHRRLILSVFGTRRSLFFSRNVEWFTRTI